jgi:hypothetical protein
LTAIQRIKRAGEAAPRLFVTHWVHNERPFDRGRSNPGGTVFWLIDGFFCRQPFHSLRKQHPTILAEEDRFRPCPVHAILRCDAGCVQAAIACSAELPVKYGYGYDAVVVSVRKSDGTIDVRKLQPSKSASPRLVTRFARRAGLPPFTAAPKKDGDAARQHIRCSTTHTISTGRPLKRSARRCRTTPSAIFSA